jgi:hypothetical protein
MMQTVQLAITDGRYEAAVREALARSCAWHIESVGVREAAQNTVLVLDEAGLERLALPLVNPERVVLITRKDPQTLAEAWDAGIVSVVSDADPLNTILLAIMAAGLRVAKSSTLSGISPSHGMNIAPLAPGNQVYGSKRSKSQ